MRAKKIFISYPSQSIDKMRELAEYLGKKSFNRVWRDDEHIEGGQIISDQLEIGLQKSDCCVLVLSKHTEKSAWCMQEIGAFWGAGKPIIVYRTDPSVDAPALFAGRKLANSLDQVVELLKHVPLRPLPSPPPPPIVKRVFPHLMDGDFLSCVKLLAGRARKIRLIGTGIDILSSIPLRTEILDRAAAGSCTLEVCLGDPYSPEVETRLIEETLGDPQPVLGKEGIIDRAGRLTEHWRSYRFPKGEFEVRLFTHYPTFALLIFDDDYFFYPYGTARQGTFSPDDSSAGGVTESNEVVKFFEPLQMRMSSRAISTALTEPCASSLADIGDVDEGDLWTFALYYVPPAKSLLYQWGSKVLGYDLRNRTPMDSEWEKSGGRRPASLGFPCRAPRCIVLS